jgi:hypothetical protein
MATRAEPNMQYPAQPIFLDCHVDFPPLKHRPSLTTLPNEILAEIFSYLIPSKTSIPLLQEKHPKEAQSINNTIDNIESKQQGTPTGDERKVNPLSFMSASSRFYHVARQHPHLKYRIYSIEVTPDEIVFEGKTNRPLGCLQAGLSHINSLQVVLHVGRWGNGMKEGQLAKFVKNYEELFRVFDGPRMEKRRALCHMRLRVLPAYQGETPGSLQEFSDQVFTALRSGDEADLADVKWWVEEDEEGGVDQASVGLAGLVRYVRHGEISNGLRRMAGCLYRE